MTHRIKGAKTTAEENAIFRGEKLPSTRRRKKSTKKGGKKK